MFNRNALFSLFVALLFTGSLTLTGCSADTLSGPVLDVQIEAATTTTEGGSGSTGNQGGSHNEVAGKSTEGGSGSTGNQGGSHNEVES